MKTSEVLVRQHFSNFFNSYAKAINTAHQRTGSLFQNRFGRMKVDSDRYFTRLIHYIHFNPQKHGFVEDFRAVPRLDIAECRRASLVVAGACRGPAEAREFLAMLGLMDWHEGEPFLSEPPMFHLVPTMDAKGDTSRVRNMKRNKQHTN